MNPASTEPRPDGSGSAQYLTFVLGGEVFAIGILVIKEIIEYGGLTEVPLMPPCIRGVINLRGAVVPVMDLMARFGKPSAAVGKRTCIVIVEVAGRDEPQTIGVIVDAVHAVVEIADNDIAPPPSFGARIDADFIDAMGKIDDRFIIILNVNRALSADDVSGIGAAGGGGGSGGSSAGGGGGGGTVASSADAALALEMTCPT
jgi:purine-binding chemotaxis protein CheW